MNIAKRYMQWSKRKPLFTANISSFQGDMNPDFIQEIADRLKTLNPELQRWKVCQILDLDHLDTPLHTFMLHPVFHPYNIVEALFTEPEERGWYMFAIRIYKEFFVVTAGYSLTDKSNVIHKKVYL